MPRMTEAELRAYELRLAAQTPGKTIGLVLDDNNTPESEIQDQIEAECRRRGWYVVRSRMDRPTTTALGVPDLIIAHDGGVTLWVEVKRPGGKLRPEQAGAQLWLGKLGHRHMVAHSLAEFLTALEAL